MFIGENGSAKTSILEAINFCLSPSFLSDKIKHTDFFNGTDDPIEICVKFDATFSALLPDGYTTQSVNCDRVFLRAKKRDKAKAGKIFTELVVTEHAVVPNRPKDNEEGWQVVRANGSKFKFGKRQLSFPVDTVGLPRSFYFGRGREKQISKGFRTSFNTVIDDFNWRFQRAVRNSDPPLRISAQKEELEASIIDTIDKKLIKNTIEQLNSKLGTLGINEIQLSLLNGTVPFESVFLNTKKNSVELPTEKFGSGIEMIISLMFLETLATLSKENVIVIIDEPELHLHPRLQTGLVNYLLDLSNTTQVLCSSHSPYLFKNCCSYPDVGLIVCTNDEAEKIEAKNIYEIGELFPWSPSWGEVNFRAFNLPTVEFHNELYGYVQESQVLNTIKAMDEFLENQGVKKTEQWIEVRNGIPINPYDVTLPTFIRHLIHHPENTNNGTFDEEQLRASITTLIEIIE